MVDYLNPAILTNWTLADIDFTADCESAAKFAALFIIKWDYSGSNYERDDWNGSSSLFTKHDEFPYGALINAAHTVAPTPFLNLSRGTIVNWADGLNSSSRETYKAMYLILDHCQTTFCRNLSWKGNPDLAGIGVSGLYLTECRFAMT